MQRIRPVPDPSTLVFVRRGVRVQGPVLFAKMVALLQSGTLKPTDEFATTASGPWTPLRAAVARGRSELPVVDSYTIKRAVFGGYLALYSCPRCDESLHSSEAEMAEVETCPSCGLRYRLPPQAAQQVAAARLAQERQLADKAAAAKRDRERKAAERQAAVAQREQERRRQADANREQERRRQADVNREPHAVPQNVECASIDRAAATRARPGCCWYCGCPAIGRLPQCPACCMVSGVRGM